MKHLLSCLGIAAALHLAPAVAQSTHTHPPSKPATAEKKKPAEAKRAKKFASAFDDYRPFNPDEPLKAWRAANDEVREAGGHIGIHKSEQAGSKP